MKLRYFGLVLVLVFTSALAAREAHAQSFELYAYDGLNQESLDSIELMDWLNQARCLCDANREDDTEVAMYLRVRDVAGNLTTDEVYFYLGDDCDNPAVAIGDVCRELAVINHSDFNEEQSIAIPTHWVVSPVDGQCVETNGGTTTFYIIMGDPNNTPTATHTLTYDTAGPGVPENVLAQANASTVTVSWNPPATDDENVEFYDVLCALGGAPVPGQGGAASWVSTLEVCGEDLAPNAPDPDLVCGSVQFTGSELVVNGLEVHQEYSFAVVAVDESGNPGRVSDWVTVSTAPPEPSPRPGGCSCATPPTPGSTAGGLLLGLLALMLQLALSRRRRGCSSEAKPRDRLGQR